MPGSLRPSLAQQLKPDQPTGTDPDTAYSSLDGLKIPARDGNEGREHYLDVGPSKMRMKSLPTEQTLLSEKYAGNRTGRMKIFDDDEDEDEEEEAGVDGGAVASEGSSGSGYVGGADGVGDEEDGDPEQDDEEDGEEDEDDEDEELDGSKEDKPDEREGNSPLPASTEPKLNGAGRVMDPIASLRESRMKDVEKGRGIRRQRVSLTRPLARRPLTMPSLRTCSSPSSPSASPSRKPSPRLTSCPYLSPPTPLARSRTSVPKLYEVLAI